MLIFQLYYSCKDSEKHLKNVTNIFEKNMIPSLTVNRYTGSDIRVRDDSMSCAHVAIAVQGPGYSDPDFVVMDVAASVSVPFFVCLCQFI